MYIILVISCQSIEIKEEILFEPSSEDTALELQSGLQPLELEELYASASYFLDEFEQIGIEHINRSLGTDGYTKSVELILEAFRSDYYLEIQTFNFPLYQIIEDPSIMMNDEAITQPSVFWYSPSGEGAAELEGVNLTIPPPSSPNSTDSGCEQEDFTDFTSGKIALIQRGGCTFSQKILNAQEAGAVAVFVFNEGQNGRTETVIGMLDDQEEYTIPMFGLSYEQGVLLADLPEETLIEYSVVVDFDLVESQNIIAYPEYLNVNDPYILLSAHLDSVPQGPGINDNGSGSAALLAAAQMWAGEELPVAYALWGAEEYGLIGSSHFVNTATNTDLARIQGLLNFDMIGSENGVRMVYDGDGSDFNLEGPTGSERIERYFAEHFEDRGLSFIETAFDGRSDYGPFIAEGVPAGGLFTGAESIKTGPEAELFGGERGEAYDRCYHKECDRKDKVNYELYLEMLDAMGSVTLRLGEELREANSSSLEAGQPVDLERRGVYLLR